MSPAHTTIVVPCFDEATRLSPERFQRFGAEHEGVRFVFVDDGSSDATPRILEALVAGDPTRFALHTHEERRGKGEAVRSGVRAALADAPFAVGYWDADLSTPLEAIPAFEAVLRDRPDARIVLGARVKLVGRTIERQVWRHYLGRVFATAVSVVLGLPVYDTQCGAKLLRVDDETRALFDAPWQVGWTFDVELLARFASARRAAGRDVLSGLYELPLAEWRHRRGSKIGLRDFLIAPVELARIARNARRRG